ncbi:hypothetical protein SS05631_c02430 [Sinorhizobium sp. CCBAU 05631]|uniref:Uncharacterized protein n=1 Tax=Rhizobium fredii TaxID=380 RepID=A0A2L0H151_RHIFR|nr:hypothetical protein SS05631_c02430 [Sinorhizobium sp. CCBAU 05631]AUX75180.1 hypothetical protein NXT3_CH00576 [Sinorhizobium fredii]
MNAHFQRPNRPQTPASIAIVLALCNNIRINALAPAVVEVPVSRRRRFDPFKAST